MDECLANHQTEYDSKRATYSRDKFDEDRTNCLHRYKDDLKMNSALLTSLYSGYLKNYSSIDGAINMANIESVTLESIDGKDVLSSVKEQVKNVDELGGNQKMPS